MSGLDNVKLAIQANSSLNYYKNATQQNRRDQNSTPCNENSTGSCKGYYADFNATQFQTFDVERRTQFPAWANKECYDECMEQNLSEAYCRNRCMQMVRDYV